MWKISFKKKERKNLDKQIIRLAEYFINMQGVKSMQNFVNERHSNSVGADSVQASW